MSFLFSPLRRTAAPASLSSISARAFSSSQPSQLARLTVVGRLGTDPEISETSKGSSIIKYVVGSTSGPKDNKTTSWFRVASFAPEGSGQRDFVMGLSKGTLIYLEGDASMSSYTDGEGKKQSSLNLVQTKIEVLKRPQPRDEENSS